MIRRRASESPAGEVSMGPISPCCMFVLFWLVWDGHCQQTSNGDIKREHRGEGELFEKHQVLGLTISMSKGSTRDLYQYHIWGAMPGCTVGPSAAYLPPTTISWAVRRICPFWLKDSSPNLVNPWLDSILSFDESAIQETANLPFFIFKIVCVSTNKYSDRSQ